jgi:hypothetical protein
VYVLAGNRICRSANAVTTYGGIHTDSRFEKEYAPARNLRVEGKRDGRTRVVFTTK